MEVVKRMIRSTGEDLVELGPCGVVDMVAGGACSCRYGWAGSERVLLNFNGQSSHLSEHYCSRL